MAVEEVVEEDTEEEDTEGEEDTGVAVATVEATVDEVIATEEAGMVAETGMVR